MRIERAFGGPNKWTFTIKPIAKLLKEEMIEGVWLDPFAGMNSPAHIRNDINPQAKADYHLDALVFLKQQETNSISGGILYDPPYSVFQMITMYKLNDGRTLERKQVAEQKDEIARIIKPNGKVICCGWNSNGLGKARGFKLERVLLNASGASHNDTIVTVERKINSSLF
jgi:hypothetical protein